MRIAIIAPPYPLEEGPAPPLGVCYVAAAFQAAGADVRIFDFVVSGYSKQKLAAWMADFQPEAIGSTSVTLNFYDAAKIVMDAKSINPSIVAMMGGPHVTFTAQETLEAYPLMDLIVLGEGEKTISELYPVLSDRKSWSGVTGITYRDGGAIQNTGPRDLISDLNTLPLPARYLLPLSRYRAMGFPVSITTSRGCPHRCIFCQGRRIVGSKMRFRDISLVADEIAHILGLGFERINVADDLFTAKKERVLALCDEIRTRGLRFGWGAFSRVNTLDLEMAQAMRGAGCDCISFGLETGNQEMLDRIQKAATLDQARRATDICKQAGVSVHATFIAGLPGETRQTLAETSQFAQSLDVPYGYHVLAPFPGTTIMEKAQDFDIEILTKDWSLYDANHAVTRTSAISPQDALDFVAEFDEVIASVWRDLEKERDAGTIAPMDHLRLEGKERLGLLFSILSEDLIESQGLSAPETGPESALDGLAQNIAAATKYPRDIVNKTLEWFLKLKLIELWKENGSAFWRWTPNT